MGRASRVLVRISTVVAAALVGAAAADPPAPPLKIMDMSRDVVLQKDGTIDVTFHSEVQVQDAQLINAIAQISVGYIEDLQSVEIKSAYTLKANGEKIPVAPSAILTQQAPSVRNAPIYSDMKLKVIIFPNVQVGDSTVYTTVTHSKPALSNSFQYDVEFPPTLFIAHAKISVTAPDDMPLYTEGQGLTPTTVKNGHMVTYKAEYANDKPVSDDNEPLSRFDRSARFSISSFKSYDDLAAAYAGIADSKIMVTADVTAKANEITAGISDRRAQARAIHDWVAKNIRYVAIEFGNTRLTPHGADAVLANGYGDCKDHAVLYAALLRAKGIQSNLVVITTANSFKAAKVPTFGVFNHMINWIPEFSLYTDTTDPYVPFGYIAMSEYGKPVLKIGGRSGALDHAPILKPGDSVVKYVASAKFDAVGHVTGTSTTTAYGAYSSILRGFGIVIKAAPDFAHKVLSDHGMPRATGTVTPEQSSELNDHYAVTASYTTPGVWRGAMEGRPFQVPDGLPILSMTSSLFLDHIASEKYQSAALVPCHSGQFITDYTLEFPADVHLAKQPSDTTIKTAHYDYKSHWSATDHSISVHRDFTARFDTALCTSDAISETKDTIARIRRDLQALVQLTPSANRPPPPPGSSSGFTPPQRITE